MKTPVIVLLWFLLLFVSPTQAQPDPAAPSPAPAYISDTVQIPLHAGASNRHKVIGMVRGSSPVEVLKVDAAKGYTQIRTPAGANGWLPSNQVTHSLSSQEQLTATRQELEQLKTRYFEIQQHMDSMANNPDGETTSYPRLYEEALRLRQQLAQYRKVAAETVAIDERNKALQEQVVTLERELQMIQQENQALRNDNDNIRLLMGLVILGACLLVAVMMPRIREQKRAQWSQL